MRTWRTATEAETEALGASLAAELQPDGVLFLSGDLGSGKTVLTRGLARGLGIDPREVQSPTFTLIREHAQSRLIHIDLYRLEPEDAETLGLDELLAGPGVKVVEWAERLPPSLRAQATLELHLHRIEGGREIHEVLHPGPSLHYPENPRGC